MPRVTIKGIEGVFTDQQKAEVIQKVAFNAEQRIWLHGLFQLRKNRFFQRSN